MTKEELLRQMSALADMADREEAHQRLDDLLLEYIGDEEITEAFKGQERWYG